MDSVLMITAFVAAGWWAVARSRLPVALGALSLVALGLAAVTLLAEGLHWQMVPWQLVATACAAASISRWLWPGHSRRWSRIVGRLGLLGGLTLGGLGLLFASVPLLPRPAGQHPVGSEIFHWTDPQRAEVLTVDPWDRREVVAQAWYPTDVSEGQRVPYFEAQDRLPAMIDLYPSWFFNDFRQVDTHAIMSPVLSAERAVWPVLLFSPGWGASREDYTGLCVDLASRGYVVVALSHPYESAVSVLASGQVVGTSGNASQFGASMADMSDIRAADSSFVLDQLIDLARIEPTSPLVGHLDVQHVGMIGHSLGGATAVQVISSDARFQVGVNIDGTLSDSLAAARLDRPFLWLQSDGQHQDHYLQVRDELMGGLRQDGHVIVVGGSVHQSFSDAQSYFSAIGRGMLGDGARPEAADDITWRTGDVVTAFVGPYLGGPAGPNLEQVLASHPSLREERHAGPRTTP
jgi:predicted dienelactone hydrolase